jgi:hypothetical protein
MSVSTPVSPTRELTEDELHWCLDWAEAKRELADEARALDAEAEAMGAYRFSEMELLELAEADFEASRARPEEWPERQVKREAVRRVLASLYPDGIPDQAALPNKLLCQAVAARLSFLVPRVGGHDLESSRPQGLTLTSSRCIALAVVAACIPEARF